MSKPLTWVEINLKNLTHNLAQFGQVVSGEVKSMAVVKANAYGHGMVEIARAALANKIEWLGVASAAEALQLRQDGISAPILVLSFYGPDEIAAMIKQDISFVVFDPEQLDKINELAQDTNKQAKVHLKIDTGTSRLGLLPDQALEFGKAVIKAPQVKLEGVMTHFSSSEEADKAYTLKQLKLFQGVVDQLRAAGGRFMAHSACSAAAFAIPETHNDLVRLGISIYGLWPSAGTRALVENGIALKPVLSWKTKVIQVKELPAKTYIGYGNTYQMTQDGRIATLPVGYWDGYDRLCSNRTDVLINGQRCPIRGRVCMNMIMVEVSAVGKVQPGDEVVLLGKQDDEEITADELAEKIQTVNYEIVTRINPQLPRLIVDK